MSRYFLRYVGNFSVMQKEETFQVVYRIYAYGNLLFMMGGN